MGSIYKEKGKNVWMLSYKDEHGIWRRRSSGERDEQAARLTLADREKQIELRRLGYITHGETRDTPIHDLAAKFAHSLELDGRCRGYVTDVARTMDMVLAHAGVASVGELDAQTLHRALAAFGDELVGPEGKKRPRSKRTRNKARGFFRHFFKWLIERGLWDKNPVEAIRKIPETDRRRKRAISVEEFQRLCEVAPRYREVIYRFAASTGLRRGAIKELLWQDVDFEGGVITVPVIRDKARRGHRVPMSQSARRVLEEWREARPALPTAKVFPKVPRAETMRRDLEAAGIAFENAKGMFSFHALRGQLATDLARAGVHPEVARQILGHADVQTTMRYYTHADDAMAMRALDRVDELRGELPGDEASERAG